MPKVTMAPVQQAPHDQPVGAGLDLGLLPRAVHRVRGDDFTPGIMAAFDIEHAVVVAVDPTGGQHTVLEALLERHLPGFGIRVLRFDDNSKLVALAILRIAVAVAIDIGGKRLLAEIPRVRLEAAVEIMRKASVGTSKCN